MTPKSDSAAPIRAAIYARQSVAEPEGIKRQVEACAELAASRDYVVVETYEDNNVSGYKARGEGTAFDRMLADARAGKFDVLIVRKLDRLGRSLSALESLTAAKVPTVTTDGALDLTSASGRLIANVLTAVSRNESEVKAERRVFANASRRSDGVPTSGRVPYGYRWVSTKERA
jgi:DNA invertase Pin-like site-specific DNA recombinase